MKHNIKLIRQFAYLISVFVVVTIAVAALVTYFFQVQQYRSLCKDRIMAVGDYLVGLIMEDPEDFRAYKEYYEEYCKEIKIPKDFTESSSTRDKFFTAFRATYPDKSFKIDVMPDELTDELKNLYYTWRHEYWLLTFEQARASFNLPYTYFLILDEDAHYSTYMIDGERTEDPENPGYLYMGDTYYVEPDRYELLWNTYLNGIRYDAVFEWDNEWGHTYSSYTPLVIGDECIGLVVAEVGVSDVNSMIRRATILLVLQLGAILIILTALLLFAIDRNHIRRINTLSEQINEFSSKRAYETVDAIRKYPYGADEIALLATDTADMIQEIQVHEAKIAQAAQFKSDFLANMSHEIRTPMNAIVGLSELTLKEDLGEKSRDYVEKINSAANTMLVIINDILDFSRIEAGAMEIAPVDYDVKQMVNDLITMISMGLNEKPVVMRLNIAPDIPQFLHGDSARIRQVLGNVVSNAVKFTKEGSVTVNVDYDHVDDQTINLKFRVADTGIGIRKQDYERIFESFCQVDSARSRDVEGTGLGLAITQRLVGLMNGTIEVESEYGVGSVFRIMIPQGIGAAPEPEIAGDEESSGEAAGRNALRAPNATVLVVDDNKINLYVAKNILDIYEIKTKCVLSGEQAIKAVEKFSFDLILMDYMMPQMDGIEATKKIREAYPEYNDIPVIAFTANAVEEARELLMKEGMDDFIAKPVKGKEMEAILLKWLPKDKWE